MNTLFLIENPINIEQIQDVLAKHVDSKVFTLNYFTHKMLVKNNISHEIGELYLKEEDRIFIDDLAIYNAINWSKHDTIKDLLTFQEINLASLLELEIWQYLMPFYMNSLQIIRIIEREKPQTIIGASYLNDFIKRICKSKNIDFYLIDKVEQPSLYHDKINIKFNIGKIPISLHISRNQFMKLKRILGKLINSIFTLNPDLKSIKKSILLVDFNPVMYDVLIKELSPLNKNILLLNQRRPAIWNMSSFKVIRNSRCKIIRLDEFEKKLGEEIKRSMNVLTTNLSKVWGSDAIFEEIFKIDSYTFWYSIKDSFKKICNSRFEESVRRIILLEELFQRFDISVILEWAESGQEEKEILHMSKKKNIKSINLQHALMTTSRDWDKYHGFVLGFSHRFLSDKQAVWGELTKKRAISFGYDEKDILVTGSPRHDKLFKNVQNKKTKGVILLATTGVSGVSAKNSPIECYEKFENFVREVYRISKLFPDKQLIVKPHPFADPANSVVNLIREIDPNIPIIYEANLIDLINSCDLLITFNNSTILLDSMILETPTISLLIEKWAEDEEIVKEKGVLSISDITELETGMKKMLYDMDSKNTVLKNSKEFISKYFSNRGNASKEMAKMLDKY